MILYNERVDTNNHRTLGDRHVAETLALLDDDGWTPGRGRADIGVAWRRVEVQRVDGSALVSDALRARVTVRATRAETFDLLSHPRRAPEWDSSDRGFQWVERFDDDHTVFRNFNRPPLFAVRDSVIYRVERAAIAPGRSLYCARSVVHAACPVGDYLRILQPIFAWDVVEVGDGRCEVTVLCSTPENLLPRWLFPLVVTPGWVHILRGVRGLVERPALTPAVEAGR